MRFLETLSFHELWAQEIQTKLKQSFFPEGLWWEREKKGKITTCVGYRQVPQAIPLSRVHSCLGSNKAIMSEEVHSAFKFSGKPWSPEDAAVWEWTVHSEIALTLLYLSLGHLIIQPTRFSTKMIPWRCEFSRWVYLWHAFLSWVDRNFASGTLFISASYILTPRAVWFR